MTKVVNSGFHFSMEPEDRTTQLIGSATLSCAKPRGMAITFNRNCIVFVLYSSSIFHDRTTTISVSALFNLFHTKQEKWNV